MGIIAGDLVRAGMNQVKDETRKEILDAVGTATERIQNSANEENSSKIGWTEAFATAITTVIAAGFAKSGLSKVLTKKEI